MDYYKNIDKLCCPDSLGRVGQRRPAVEGIDYAVIQDLDQEPVTLQDFADHCRVDFNVDDNLLAFYLKSARQYLEQWAQLSFGVKTIRFRALRVPNRWKLMFGPYVSVNDPDRTLFGDILMHGGTEVDIELTTGWPNDELPEAIKVAICRYAAGLYAIRENLIYSENGVPHEPTEVMDEAQKMLAPFMNVTWP